LTCDFWAENAKNNLAVLHCEENKAVRAGANAHLIDDETVAKMGHPVVVVRSDVGHPSSISATGRTEMETGPEHGLPLSRYWKIGFGVSMRIRKKWLGSGS
jgi:hypothetical protein